MPIFRYLHHEPCSLRNTTEHFIGSCFFVDYFPTPLYRVYSQPRSHKNYNKHTWMIVLGVVIVSVLRRRQNEAHVRVTVVMSAIISCSNKASLYRIISIKLPPKNCLLVNDTLLCCFIRSVVILDRLMLLPWSCKKSVTVLSYSLRLYSLQHFLLFVSCISSVTIRRETQNKRTVLSNRGHIDLQVQMGRNRKCLFKGDGVSIRTWFEVSARFSEFWGDSGLPESPLFVAFWLLLLQRH